MAQHTQTTGLTQHYIEALVATLGANGYGETLQRFNIEELRGPPVPRRHWRSLFVRPRIF